MNNDYKLVKNTEWKEGEVNDELVEVPLNWNVKKIADLLKSHKGAIKTGPFGSDLKNNDIQSSGIKVYMQDNVFSNDFIRGKNYISPDKYETKLQSCTVFPEDILITARGTIGKFAIVPLNAEKGVLHSSLIRIQLQQNIVLNNYSLLVFNKSSYIKNYLNRIVANTTIPALYAGNISNCDILIPPITQQSAIADILSEQESIIQDIESLISKYESRFQYLSEELLSGRLRVKEVDGQLTIYKNADDNWKEVEVNGEMKEIPVDWSVEKLKNHILVINGYAFPKSQMLNEKLKNSVSIIKIGNIQEDNIIEDSGTGQNYYNGTIKELFVPKYNDLIIGLSGANAGKTGIYKLFNKTVLNQRNAIVRIKSDSISQDFFNHFWFMDALQVLKETTKDSAIPNISSDDIENIDFFVLDKEEQANIAQLLNFQEELIVQQKEFLTKEKQKFDWLLDNLLSGKYLIKEKE